MLEARLNLGEVYLSLNDPEKAEVHFLEILKLQSDSIRDRETISTFSEACFGLARVALARNIPDEAIKHSATRAGADPPEPGCLATACHSAVRAGRVSRGREIALDLAGRVAAAEAAGTGGEFHYPVRECPHDGPSSAVLELLCLGVRHESRFRKARSARVLKLAQHVVEMTKQQDPLALDVLAAAMAANGQYDKAV